MKRTAMILAVLLIASTILSACGSSPLVGTWTMEEDSMSVDFTFNSDGKGQITAMGGILNVPFTYTVSGDNLQVKISDESGMLGDMEDGLADCKFAVNGNTLSLSVDGETTTLTKK